MANTSISLPDFHGHIFAKPEILSKDLSVSKTLLVALACSLLVIRLAKAKSKKVSTYPWIIPILKSTVPFVFHGYSFFTELRRLFPNGRTVKVEILGNDIYIVQGPQNITEMFRSPVLTVTRAYSLVLKQCFGMEQKAVDAYLADTSGSRDKPIKGSVPRPEERISYMTHENLVEGLLTTGLPAATTNFILNLNAELKNIRVGDEWISLPDLTSFFEVHVGRPLLQTLYGERLLDENPDFVKDIWAYDATVMDLARRLPWFWISQAYSMRDKLVSAVKQWHHRGLALMDCPNSCPTAFQEDPIWGTSFMRNRYDMLLNASGQTKSSVASTNLALMWASITNVIPSSAALLINILQHTMLHTKIREQLEALPSYQTTGVPSVEEVEKLPLLLSAYAETLRLNVQIHIPRSASHHDMKIGGTVVPRDKLIMTNIMLAHMNDDVWNTKDGKHPLSEFWAERFLVYPSDPTSGPTKAGHTTRKTSEVQQPHFSTEGLDGAWIPFGGGQHACPGRILAKRIMLSSVAMLLTHFDFELENEQLIKFGSPRFGFGIRKPVGSVRFRIRRRS